MDPKSKISSEETSYAYLPEDILLDMLNDSPRVVEKLADFINVSEEQKHEGRNALELEGLIKSVSTQEFTTDLIAVDGANIVEKLTGSDLLMAIAVGVEGLKDTPSHNWTEAKSKQHYSWQDAVPHHTANARLSQGIMFLMELSILSKAEHQIRIMDGSHLTSIMKLNSLLSAKDDEFADEHYVEALNDFLQKNYDKLIPDIPDILDEAFSNPAIIGMTKYSSSREILDGILKEKYSMEVPGDDKTFFGMTLNGGEYTKPMPVGQGKKERFYWNEIHIKCNLGIPLDDRDREKLNTNLKDILDRFRPGKDEESKSNLYFLYYKPYENGACFRIEVKKELTENDLELEKVLQSIKYQTFFPEIQEPYPQYLVDVIAKNISFGMDALKHAIRANPKLASNQNFSQLFSYRSN